MFYVVVTHEPRVYKILHVTMPIFQQKYDFETFFIVSERFLYNFSLVNKRITFWAIKSTEVVFLHFFVFVLNQVEFD